MVTLIGRVRAIAVEPESITSTANIDIQRQTSCASESNHLQRHELGA